MTREQMQARSNEKVKQVQDLMKLLNLTVEAKDYVGEDRFITKMIAWTDQEQYPLDPVSPLAELIEAGLAPAAQAVPEVPENTEEGLHEEDKVPPDENA